MWKEKISLALFASILFFLMPSVLTAQAPCDDDDDIIIGSFSYSGPVCPGGTVFLLFTLTPEDDDDGDGFYDVTYSFGSQEFTLLDIATGHVVGHTVNIPTTAVFISILNDDANCTNAVNQSIAIQVLPSLIISIGNLAQPACGQSNGSFTAQGSSGASPYQYSLDGVNFQNNGTFSGLGAGNYTVTVRDANGCTGQQAVQLSSSAAPTVGLSNVIQPACGQSNGSFTAQGSGGASPYQYSLDGFNFQNNGTFSGLGAGSYTVTVRDANGCTGQQAVQLSSSAAPTVGLSNVVQPACGQSNGSFTAQGSGGASPYQYSLDGFNFQNNGTFSGLGAGSYTVTVRDANGCTGQQAVQLSSSAAPTVGLSNVIQPACGQSNGSFTAQGSGGASPYQYSLDGFNFQNNGTFSSLGAGSYTVTVRDANGCTGQQAITLNSSSNLVITLTDSTAPDCKNDNGTIRLSAQGGSPPYVFSIDGINFQSDPLFDGLGPGQYVVYSRDNQGCISTLEVTLEDPVAGLTAAQATTSTSIICLGEAFNLIANLPAGTTGGWSVDREGIAITNPSSPESSALIWEAGNYVLTWTLSTADCNDYSSASVTLSVVPTPVAQQDGPVPVGGQDVEILILGNDVHLPGATISILQTPSQGVVTLNANSINYTPDADAAGADTLIYQICHPDCELLCDTAMVLIMNADGSEICDLDAAPDNVFPEGITPNGDGFNDQLEFIVVDPTSCPFNFANSELIIFNRWGDRVFEAAPYNNDWNGNSQAGELPAGVYYYVLKVRLEQEFVKFGNVSIFR